MLGFAVRLVLVLGGLGLPLLGQVMPRPLFDLLVTPTPAVGAIQLATDFDGDGDQDLVSVGLAPAPATISGLANDGVGNFDVVWTLPPPAGGPQSMVAAGTGSNARLVPGSVRDDFIINIGNEVRAYATNPAPAGPTLVWSVTAGAPRYQTAYADFAGDGDTDVALQLANGTITLIVSNGTGPPLVMPGALAPPQLVDIAAIEVSGDAIPDLVCTTAAPSLLGYRLVGNTFVLVASEVLPGLFAKDAIGADFDGDGDTDIALLIQTPSFGIATCVLRRQGPTMFNVEPPILFIPSLGLDQFSDAAAADADGDGDLDYITSAWGLVVHGNTSGNLTASGLRREFPTSGNGLHVRDFTGDGRLDVVSSHGLLPGSWDLGLDPALGPETAYGWGVSPGDYDGDGDLDLSPGLPGAQTPANPFVGLIVKSTGGGFESLPSRVSGGPPGTTYFDESTPIDVDGDGDLHLIADREVGFSRATVILINQGDFRFVDSGTPTTNGSNMGAGWPPNVPFRSHDVVGDVDGDGDLDFCTTDGTPTSMLMQASIWRNQGGGGLFSPLLSLPQGIVEAVGDFSADGVPDLIVATLAANGGPPFSLFLVPGLGGGAFASAPGWIPLLSNLNSPNPPPLVPWYFIPHLLRVATKDVDGDGFSDVVASMFGSHYLYSGSAVGLSVTPTIISSRLGLPRGIALADVDGDRIAEILTWDIQRLEVNSVLMPTPSGFPTLHMGLVHVVEDWDADGDADILLRGDLMGGPGFAVGPSTISPFARGLSVIPPAGGRRLQFGAGTPGSGGLVPILGCTGPVRAFSNVSLRILEGRANAPGVLGIGLAIAPTAIPPGTLYLLPLALVPVTLSPAGNLDLPVQLPSSLIGTDLVLQAGLGDPGATAGVSLTQAMAIRIGP